MNKYIKYLIILSIISIVAFTAHYLVLSSMDVDHYWDQSGYSLLGLYAFGAVASLIVCVLTFLAHWSMPQNLGFVFLGLMTVKVVANYIFIQNGLGLFEDNFIEYNFLVVFFLFLFFDVFIAFQALNQEDNSK